MKKKSLVILAFRNIIYKKSTTIQIVLSTLIAFVVLNSLFVYKKMMLNSIAEMSLRLASSYNIIYYIDENKVKEFEEHIDDMKEISGIKKYSFLSNDYQYRECEIEIDGVLYKCINNGRNISRTDRFDIQKFDSKYSLICKNEIKEAKVSMQLI